jgi:hypothetical protein
MCRHQLFLNCIRKIDEYKKNIIFRYNGPFGLFDSFASLNIGSLGARSLRSILFYRHLHIWMAEHVLCVVHRTRFIPSKKKRVVMCSQNLDGGNHPPTKPTYRSNSKTEMVMNLNILSPNKKVRGWSSKEEEQDDNNNAPPISTSRRSSKKNSLQQQRSSRGLLKSGVKTRSAPALREKNTSASFQNQRNDTFSNVLGAGGGSSSAAAKKLFGDMLRPPPTPSNNKRFDCLFKKELILDNQASFERIREEAHSSHHRRSSTSAVSTGSSVESSSDIFDQLSAELDLLQGKQPNKIIGMVRTVSSLF